MIYLPYTPTEPLSSSVETIFYLQGYCPEHSVERLVPDGSVSLVVELDDQPRFVYDNETLEKQQECRGAWISGMHSGFISISALQNTELLAIRFAPGGGYPFFKRPLSELNDAVVDAHTILGAGIVELRRQVQTAPEPELKLRVAQQYLLDIADFTLAPPPAITNAVAAIRAAPTVGKLDEIIAQSQYSHKHFISLFKKYVGLSPKAFQRVLRFAQVIPLIHEKQRINWAQLSADCGYYDQAHFIKDFQNFSGFNPQDFLNDRHDRLNFFPTE